MPNQKVREGSETGDQKDKPCSTSHSSESFGIGNGAGGGG
ncbi:uncharacterized protein FIBRA_07161 [Fibroporia radiculosa]|uniref:Uncharacterized protein n=1 Tax=Fibroporia radiculosa TaxID=599839 RepID=J4H4G7_9APHY|nr:uncharacterized protein FIBRA_07161 [Fibroporia radiculosa]CCM04964.1 predicted protein [Fibroporia radiculosa]